VAKKQASKPTKTAKAPAKKKAKAEEPELETTRSFEPDPSVRTPGPFTAEEIGHVAGDLWGLLHTDGGMSLATAKKSLAAPSDMVVAAVGWLAREGKLTFETDARTVKVSLR